MSNPHRSETYRSISIPRESLLQDYMTHQSAVRRISLNGISVRGKLSGMFVENQIVVNAREEASIRFLVDRCGGEVLPTQPLPKKPRGLETGREHSIEDMPTMVGVKIKGEDVALDAVEKVLRRENPEGIQVSSRAGAGTLAAKLMLAEANLPGQLNLAGMPAGFPFQSSAENFSLGDNDAFNWPEYSGKSNITKAWQLCQAFANVRSMKTPIYIAILDVGFAFVAPTDYATSLQVNLTNEGASVVGASGIGGYDWHGSAVAGVATAVVNNNIGAGGVAGIPVGAANQPVATPILFRTNILTTEIYRCLQFCIAWGIDVLNMSFEITFPKFFLPLDRNWDNIFTIAHNQGLIMVASAGNDSSELPDRVVFPATRTPGVIAVGALDASNNASRGDSNYGSSVDLWAPGTNIHTVPDPGSSQVLFNETSAAAPIVSGMAALMKSVNPALGPDDIKTILRETAWTDSPDSKSNRILNGYAALLRAMNNALPPDVFEEPNNTPETAKDLVSSAPNVWKPLGETVISQGSDVDYFHFNTTEYSDVTIILRYVTPLSVVSVELLTDDQNIVLNNFTDSRSSGSQVLTFTQAPAGSYRLAVRSVAPNYYKLQVKVVPAPLLLDIFENNDTKERAALIRLRKFNSLLDTIGQHVFYPGTYDANIMSPFDTDWYHVTNITVSDLSHASCKVKSDLAVDVSLYGPGGALVATYSHTRQIDVHVLDPESWIEVRAAKATKYSIFFGYMLDQLEHPSPLEVEVIPSWWPDPPFEINEWEKWLQVEIDDSVRKQGQLDLQVNTPLRLELLSSERSLLQTASSREGKQVLDVGALASGKYLLRVSRVEGSAARFQANQRGAVKFRIGPSLQ